MDFLDRYTSGFDDNLTSPKNAIGDFTRSFAAEIVFNAVLKRLYDTSTKMLRRDIDYALWRRYYAHVMFHGFVCPECPECLAMTCSRGCVADLPDFDVALEANIKHVSKLHDAYLKQTMEAVEREGRELEKNGFADDEDEDDFDEELKEMTAALGTAKML
jgi:hypothetical protein